MTSLTPTETVAIGIPAVLLGAAMLFFGYRIFRVLVVILAAFVGFNAGAYVDIPNVPPLATAIAGAIAGALLAFFFYRVGVFLVGAVLGYLVAMALLPATPPFDLPGWAIPLAVGVAAGLVALWLERPAIIAATSFDGAFLAWTGAWAIAGASPPDARLSLVAVIAIAIVGALVQLKITARA